MFTIIPAKPFNRSKTRLSSVLSVEQRVTLSRSLLRRTVNIARQVGEVVVVSTDVTVRRFAKHLGAWTLVETGKGLNEAICQAVQWVAARGEQVVLILPADLPLLTVANLKDMATLAQTEPAMVISPCHRQEGTNALLLFPPDLIKVSFGAHSFNKHCRAIRLAGIEPTVYRSSTIAFDLDLPQDLAALNERIITH